METQNTTQTKVCTAIAVYSREWFDKVNGNSYFDLRIEVENNGKSLETIYHSLDYGYGSAFEFEARKKLVNAGYIPSKYQNPCDFNQYCRDNNISVFFFQQKNCKKRDLISLKQLKELTK